MKRKIQHDAVNNQEDEDSSICPFCIPSDETPAKKEEKSVEDSGVRFSGEASNNKDESTSKPKYI